MRTLREYAAEQMAEIAAEYGEPTDGRDAAVERLMHRLVATCQVPDDILEAMPEVARFNEPQVTPQEYECGCVTMIRVTDRNGCSWLGRLEEPFEMRLALPCDGTSCEREAQRLARIAEACPTELGCDPPEEDARGGGS